MDGQPPPSHQATAVCLGCWAMGGAQSTQWYGRSQSWRRRRVDDARYGQPFPPWNIQLLTSLPLPPTPPPFASSDQARPPTLPLPPRLTLPIHAPSPGRPALLVSRPAHSNPTAATDSAAAPDLPTAGEGRGGEWAEGVDTPRTCQGGGKGGPGRAESRKGTPVRPPMGRPRRHAAVRYTTAGRLCGGDPGQPGAAVHEHSGGGQLCSCRGGHSRAARVGQPSQCPVLPSTADHPAASRPLPRPAHRCASLPPAAAGDVPKKDLEPSRGCCSRHQCTIKLRP